MGETAPKAGVSLRRRDPGGAGGAQWVLCEGRTPSPDAHRVGGVDLCQERSPSNNNRGQTTLSSLLELGKRGLPTPPPGSYENRTVLLFLRPEGRKGPLEEAETRVDARRDRTDSPAAGNTPPRACQDSARPLDPTLSSTQPRFSAVEPGTAAPASGSPRPSWPRRHSALLTCLQRQGHASGNRTPPPS